jgi:hypothetical protein
MWVAIIGIGGPLRFSEVLLQLHKTFYHRGKTFELALGVEVSQPMNLTIARIGGEHCKRGKNVEKMVKKCKSQKKLEKT